MNKIKQVHSKIQLIEAVNCIDDIVSFLDKDTEYQVLAYLIPAITFGSYDNGFQLNGSNLDFNEIEAIRIFNEDTELYCFRFTDPNTGKASQSMKGRIRTDHGGDLCHCHDASQILVGNRFAGKTGTYTLLREDRGFELLLPSEWVIQDPASSRLELITRNYLDVWDNGQLSYGDHRFVAIGQFTEEI